MDLVGLVAVLGAFGLPMYAIKSRNDRHRAERAQHLLPAPQNNEEMKLLVSENKLLRERVENLESIVCSVDFELNQKLAKMIDETRAGQALPAPAPPSSP